MSPIAHPDIPVYLEPRQTIFCLSHFAHIVGDIEHGLATLLTPSQAGEKPSRAASLCDDQSKPPTRRIQPGRAAKAKAAAVTHEDKSTTAANASWVMSTMTLGRLTSSKPKEISPRLRLDMKPKLKRLQSDKTKRSKAGKAGCAFGARPWICEACAFELERKFQAAEIKAGRARSEDFEEPNAAVADMRPADRSAAPKYGVSKADLEKWKSMRVPEYRIVDIRGFRFVLDVCDGAVKFMFLSGSAKGAVH